MSLGAQDQIKEDSEEYVRTLLAGYLENDTDLKILSLNIRQAEINLKKTEIQNGIELELSSGKFFISSTGGDSYFNVSPAAKISAPLINDSSITLSGYAAGGGDTNKLENAGVSFSTAIISSSVKQYKLSQIRSERALKEAKRALLMRGKETEKNFYNALESIYGSAVAMLTLEDDVYTKNIELEAVKIQGYDPSSVRYRTIALEAAAKRREAEQAGREMLRKQAEFLNDCGAPAQGDLPVIIPGVEIEDFVQRLDFSKLPKEKFTQIENANWAHYEGMLEREADGNLSLNAQGGFTINNTDFSGKASSANAGLALSVYGLELSAGTEIPLSGEDKPAFTFSVGINFNTARITALNEKGKNLNDERERLAIVKAHKNWEQTAISMEINKSDIIWEKQDRLEQLDLYKQLASDTEKYYKLGIVKESDYRNAASNTQRAFYQCLLTDIKMIKYLIDCDLYFSE
jgi:hypothetical protein